MPPERAPVEKVSWQDRASVLKTSRASSLAAAGAALRLLRAHMEESPLSRPPRRRLLLTLGTFVLLPAWIRVFGCVYLGFVGVAVLQHRKATVGVGKLMGCDWATDARATGYLLMLEAVRRAVCISASLHLLAQPVFAGIPYASQMTPNMPIMRPYLTAAGLKHLGMEVIIDVNSAGSYYDVLFHGP